MKRRSNLLIVLLVAAAFGLVGLGFLIRQNSAITAKSMEEVSARADTAKNACMEAQDATEADKQEDAAEKETEEENASGRLEELAGEDMSELAQTDPLPAHHVIFVGDSRTVGMGRAEAERADECIYIGESGEGLGWFIEKGYDQMKEAIAGRPDDPVVFNLGVNDLSEISHYLEMYATFKDDFPDTKFYFMSVNPITIETENATKAEIKEFNRILKETYGNRFLDVNALMTADGFEDVDGIHYSEKTYCDIHDYVVRALFG